MFTGLNPDAHPERVFFTNQYDSMSLPDLIEVQKSSYKWFFDVGLAELFEEINPIEDFIGRDLMLEFGEHYLDDAKFDELESRKKNITYEAPLRVRARLTNKKTGEIKEQEVYLGDFPLMTDRGTFIVNGVERVIISQLVRSAGVFFMAETAKGRYWHGAKIIPNRGAWLEIETDTNGVITVKIDRKRKVAVTALLRAFGFGTNDEIRALFKDVDVDPEIKYIEETLKKDVSSSENDGYIEVYKRIRPGDLASPENAKSLIRAMFFNPDRYDFSKVGRYMLNKRFADNLDYSRENRVLRPEDMVHIIREIILRNVEQRQPDDIDHLGNRRVRAVGELIQNKLRVGLARMERIVKDRMSTMDIANVTPNQLVNARPIIGTIKEFFMNSQLSQFMDQTNPLSELEHKRRVTALGPGGLSRERAAFEVRDVHRTHYGRICPIASSEGPNIGLVGHLASFARINEYGFIETPFRKIKHTIANDPNETTGEVARGNIRAGKEIIVKDGEEITAALAKKLAQYREEVPLVQVKPRVTNEIVYVDAFTEELGNTVPATIKIDENGYFIKDKVPMRVHGKPELAPTTIADYMDVSTKQILSIATSLVPFVEHDDSVRALMGTNMQRQAVSLIKPEAPIIGTGVEYRAAKDSGQIVIAEEDGVVSDVNGSSITISGKKGEKTYELRKFLRSNFATCINQMPIVDVDQKIKKGQVIADGPSTDQGELALGQNVTVAYISWQGNNFEDAVILSERLLHDDRYTSIHIEEYSVDVRETKLGDEQVTTDIPNISEEKLKDLDSEGIIRVGASVKSGDILVGKITPKGEAELSAEEKLIRAIFGEKAKDVKDSSLYLEHGDQGRVIDIKIFSRENGDKLPSGVIKTIQVSVAQLRKIQVGDKMAGRHGNKGVISRVVSVEDMPHMEDGTPVDIVLNPLGVISRMNLGQLLEVHLGLAAGILGYKVGTPAFNGITHDQISSELARAGIASHGKVQLFDGRTGRPFDAQTVVGTAYMLKLNHMVEDKMHQRSIGPYSMVTQQPLGGKAQSGGQRFGEMEVWALEAYGAAHTLQEILTIKSDDVIGRAKAYEAIIKNEAISKLNVPESFNVLVRELKGLCFEVEMYKNGKLMREDSKKEKRLATKNKKQQ